MSQPDKLPNICIPVLLILISLSIPSLGNAQSQSTYTCNSSVPKNLIPILRAICSQPNTSENITSGHIASESFSPLREEEQKKDTLTNQIRIYKLHLSTKQIGTVEIALAFIGIVGGIGGGVPKLFKAKNTNTAGTWVGILAAGGGGVLAAIKGWSDYNKCGSDIKQYMGDNGFPTMRTYILEKNPRDFRGLCRDTETKKNKKTKLEGIMNRMETDSEALKQLFSIK